MTGHLLSKLKQSIMPVHLPLLKFQLGKMEGFGLVG